jgi:UDP-2,3-diacylglucosamine pyrophosphatase LpxH
MSKLAIDKLRTAVDAERVGAATLSVLGELTDVREWADALTDLAERIEAAEQSIEEYAEAEGRDAKAEAKEDALAALGELVEAWEGAQALPDIDGLLAAE